MRKVERRRADLYSVWYEEVPSTGFDCIVVLVFIVCICTCKQSV